MRKDIQVWVEALRSGEFEQAAVTLYDETCSSFCCLGVYAQVNDLCDFKTPTHRKKGVDQEKIYKKIYKTIEYNFAWELINLNDMERLNFNQIADVIEKEYSK